MITKEERLILGYPNALDDKFGNNLESEVQNQVQSSHGYNPSSLGKDERTYEQYKEHLMFDIKQFFLSNRYWEVMINWLDIGCGKGLCLNEIFKWAYEEKHIPLTIDAIDIRNSLEIPEHRINFQQMDAQEFQSEPKYHLITSCWVLPYMRNQLETLTNIYNALLPRGYAAVTIHPNQMEINGKELGKNDIFTQRINRTGGKSYLQKLEKIHPWNTYTIFMEKGDQQLDIRDINQVYAQRPLPTIPKSNTFKTVYMTRRHIRKLVNA